MSNRVKINILFFCIYLLSFGTYVIELLSGIENIKTYATFVTEILLLMISLNICLRKSPYVKFFWIFLGLSSISFLISTSPIMSHLNGIREIIPIFLLFILLNELYSSKYANYLNRKFRRFAFVFLTVQIPVSTIQFIRYGPGDMVGGTYGEGGSGVLTFSIFLLVFYLIESRNNLETTTNKLKCAIPFLVFFIPIVLDETKISFILLILFFLSFVDFRKIGKSIIIIGLGVLSVILFSFLYTTQGTSLKDANNTEYLENYLIGDNSSVLDSKYEDVPRFGKIVLGIRILNNDNDLMFGKEYGVFKGSQLGISSEFSKKHQWLLVGSRPYSFFLMITGGLTLLFLIIWMMIFEVFRKHPEGVKNFSTPLLLFLAICFFIQLFYNDGFRLFPFTFIFVNILFFSKHFKRRRVSTIRTYRHPSYI